MKTLRIIIAFMFLCTNVCSKGSCSTPISEESKLLDFCVIVHIDDNTEHPFPHSIVRKPRVLQDGHTLYLIEGCDNTTIELLDENNQVVYTTEVTEGTETLALPTFLVGAYELHITRGRYTFVAEIEL